MNVRSRRALGALIVIVWLVAYIGAAGWIGALLPANALWSALYFAVAGIAWVFPLRPLFRWIEEGKSLPSPSPRP